MTTRPKKKKSNTFPNLFVVFPTPLENTDLAERKRVYAIVTPKAPPLGNFSKRGGMGCAIPDPYAVGRSGIPKFFVVSWIARRYLLKKKGH